MSKHAGGGYNVGGTAMQRKPRGWEITPRWHWRYWFGWRMRHWAMGRDHNGAAFAASKVWYYRTFNQHARAVLEETCNGGTKQQDTDGDRSPNYIATPFGRRYQRP